MIELSSMSLYALIIILLAVTINNYYTHSPTNLKENNRAKEKPKLIFFLLIMNIR